MTHKNPIHIGIGTALIVLAVVFSLVPYNPGNHQTVHQYSYGCNRNTSDFNQGYTYVDPQSALYACQNNTMLSIIIFGIGIGGAVLLVRVKTVKPHNSQ